MSTGVSSKVARTHQTNTHVAIYVTVLPGILKGWNSLCPDHPRRGGESALHFIRWEREHTSNQLYTLYVPDGLAGGLNRCVPFWLDYVYEPFTSAFMIKFIDASVINGTVCGGCEDDIEDTCPDSTRLNYNWTSKVRLVSYSRRNGKSGVYDVYNLMRKSFYTFMDNCLDTEPLDSCINTTGLSWCLIFHFVTFVIYNIQKQLDTIGS